MTDLTKIEEIANKFGSIENLKKEIKRVASVKTRLKKQKGKKTYQAEMDEVLRYDQILHEAKNLLEPKSKHVNEFDQSDIDKLDYDQTMKAIKNIQSKKTLSKWLTDTECDNDEYRNACKIEQMLLKRKSEIKPVDETYIRKSDLQAVIETIENSGNLSKEIILEMLNNLM